MYNSIYLGKSPLHARNVALVMDRNSGRVSPQYHVKFDLAFDTVTQNPLPCFWMTKAGFVRVPVRTQHTIATKTPQEPPLRGASPLRVEASIVDTISKSYDTSVTALPTQLTGTDCILDVPSIDIAPIMAMKAQTDPDTMYHHQAMREPDHEKFSAAMQKRNKRSDGEWKLYPTPEITSSPKCYNFKCCLANETQARSLDWRDHKIQSAFEYRWLSYGEGTRL